MKRIAPALLTLSIALGAPLALAQEFSESGNSVVMRLGNDVYTAGEALDITENVDGDVNAAGNAVNITAGIGGDVQAAAGNVNISGDVADDVRVAAGTVNISGGVAGDVIVFGGTVTVARGATVSGNLLVFGGTALVEGTVRGNVKIDADQATVAGPVGGDLNVNAQRLTLGSAVTGNAHLVADSITLAQAARIGGDLRYWNEEGQVNATGKVAGAATFDPSLGENRMDKEEYEGAFAGIIAAVSVFTLLYAALTIALFMLATRTFFLDSAKRLQKAPGWSLLIGLVYFVAMPGAILLLAITLIGLPVALAALAIYLMSVFFAKIIASIVLARWTELYFRKKWHPVAVYFAALGFYVALKLLSLVPVLGWAICFLIVVTAYGAFAAVKYERVQKIR